MVRSMCCRLQLDLRELLKRGNSLFGSAEQTGSIGVVTVNCARLGYVYKGNEEALLNRMTELMSYAKTSLEIKRKVVQIYMDNGLFPFTKRYLGTLRNHFSTIGVNGINEMIRNFTNDKHDITSEYGHKMAVRFLDKVREVLVAFQTETGHMYNLEATPAEGTTYRFAKEDKKRFPDILQAGTPDMPYYTNSSQLPVSFTQDAFEALKAQDDLQKKYTGGTVLHLYMNEAISDAKTCGKLVKKVVENFSLPYFTITPTFSICSKHGYLNGEYKFCPRCDDETIERKRRELSKA
jgi:ribonucleoside-triphosphate reductase